MRNGKTSTKMNMRVKMTRPKGEQVVEYQKVKLRSFEEPWFRFDAEDEHGKKSVYLPIDWITKVEVIPECPHEEYEQ